MKTFFTKKIVWLILAILVIGGSILINLSKNNGSENKSKENYFLDPETVENIKGKFSIYPNCPANLEGILTAPLIDPKDISSITPLGNLNPPGHTSPVDHNYFSTTNKGPIPLYAPADSWITEITEIAFKDNDGQYVPSLFSIRYTICNSLALQFANYTELVPSIKAEVDKISEPECKGEIVKPGHDTVERQCYYKVNIPVKSGELIGSVLRDSNGTLPFEIWAFNYNKLSRNDIDWAYYGKDDGMYPYQRSFCTFDLYSGDLKKEYYSKFGFFDEKSGNGLVPRTIEPLCGQVNQDIVGTIQGMWFGDSNKNDNSTDIEFEGKGLSFIHNNMDPRIAEIGVGGNFMSSGIITFDPKHTGTIDREFSEVKADGKIYCYNERVLNKQSDGGKILVQLMGDRELKVEYQDGGCIGNEVFKTSYNYYR